MKRNLTTAKKISQSKVWLTAKPLLGKLVKWTVWTILILNLSVVILYIAGSYQKASDAAQLTLVRICLILSLLLIISSVYGFFMDIYYLIRRHQAVYLVGIVGYIVIIAIGAILALGAAFIIGAAGGNLQG
ncbi:MAG: hypothetical protein FWG29_10125 [Treponema sp.]|nr:hypothetical protein [Treponema sp.]